jgi:hypothetical protein
VAGRRNDRLAGLTIVALVYFVKRVPETKGLELAQIEQQMQGAKVSPGATGDAAKTEPGPAAPTTGHAA